MISSLPRYMARMNRNRYFHVFCLAVLFLFIFSYTFRFPKDPDMGWHLRNGEDFINAGKIIGTDRYTFSVFGQNVPPFEWLSDIFSFLIYSRFSFMGLVIVYAVLTSLAFYLPLCVSGSPFLVNIIFLVIALEGSNPVISNGPRPQNISLVGISILMLLLIKYQERGKIIFAILIPILIFIWSSLHPGVVFGLNLILLFVAIEAIFVLVGSFNKSFYKPNYAKLAIFIAVYASSSFGFSLTPTAREFGLGLDGVLGLMLPLDLALKNSQSAIIRITIAEWSPPSYNQLSGIVFLVVALFSVSLFIGKKLTSETLRILLLILFFIYFSTLLKRNIPFFFISFLVLFLPYILTIKKNGLSWFKYLPIRQIGMLLPFAVFLFSCVKIGKNLHLIAANTSSLSNYCEYMKYPCRAMDYLREHPQEGNMYNFYNWGGYFVWQMREYPVFIDGRLGGLNQVFLDYNKISSMDPGWEEIAEKYRIQWFFIPKNHISEILRTVDGKWQTVYSDEQAMIIRKVNRTGNRQQGFD